MPFDLNFPNGCGILNQALELRPGEMMFVLGANGTGKSSLMQHFFSANRDEGLRISAHRQTWMDSDDLSLTAAMRADRAKQIAANDVQQEARYRDKYSSVRPSITLFDLVNSETARALAIAKAYESKDLATADRITRDEPSPLALINEILHQSNIPITLSIEGSGKVLASKDSCPNYSVAALSDGERNALLLASDVLTAPDGTLLLIDEPERHLHRSIISPLLSKLFELKPKCGFVVSTHDHDLPLEAPKARTLLVRSCKFEGTKIASWDADEISAEVRLDESLKRDLLGARRKMLFVEGTQSSLDKPLYSIIFPMVSVIPKGSCRDVEQAVVGLTNSDGFHWIKAFGIADGDGFDAAQAEDKQNKGIRLVPYYSVEAIYFHPDIIEKIAANKAEELGLNAEELKNNAICQGVEAIRDHTERLAKNVAKRRARKSIMEQIPNDDELLKGNPVPIANNARTFHAQYKARLDQAVQNTDLKTILTTCSIRESQAIDKICKTLRYVDREDYEKAVRTLLTRDEEALKFVRNLFGDLYDKIMEDDRGAADTPQAKCA